MNVIVYGAGKNCKMVLEAVRKQGADEIVFITDKDSNKIGGKIEGIQIVSPESIADISYELILVSVDNNFEAIKDDLIRLGMDEKTIVYFRDYFSVSPRNTGTMVCDWNKVRNQNMIYDELCAHVSEISEMERFFLMGKHNRSFKWLHYFEVYNNHFKRYIGKDVTIMEIGVNRGGSLQIWKHIFGNKAKIYGVDISEDCKQFEDEQIEIFIGDQADRDFWRTIKQEVPKLDVLIDDGGHYMEQQIITFEEMYSHVKEDGVYLCEDTATSYNPQKYGSGVKQPNTFIEYSKNFIDYLHAWISQEDDFAVNEYTETMHSLHYYFGVLAIEKRKMFPPFDMEICNNDVEKYAKTHLHGKI